MPVDTDRDLPEETAAASDEPDVDQLHLFPPPLAPTVREAKGRSVSNRVFIVTAGAAAVFALLAVVAMIAWAGERNRSSTSGDRTQIATTAARVAEAITAMDGTGNGTLGATVDQLGTAPVVSQYKEISDAIRKVMGPLKLKSIRGTVKEVYVGDIESAQARVIVRLDLVYVGDNTRVIPDQYLDMTLAKLDGAWKVDNLQVLNVALAGGPPSATPPTSTPSSSS